MIPVFFCKSPCAGTSLRGRMSEMALDIWRSVCRDMLLPQVEVYVMIPQHGEDWGPFNRTRRMRANDTALKLGSDVYVLTDDDLVCSAIDLSEAISLLRIRKDFGQLSLNILNHEAVPWKGSPARPDPINDGYVMEHLAAGGVRVMRTIEGLEWREQHRAVYDAEHAKTLRDAGYLTGFAAQQWCWHLGEGLSTMMTGGR